MVQPAKDRMCNNISEAFDRARVRSILRERDVSPHVIVQLDNIKHTGLKNEKFSTRGTHGLVGAFSSIKY